MRKAFAVPLFLTLPLAAQANAVPGLDVITFDIGDATVYGRHGTFPSGEVGFNIGHSMCNRGSVAIPWVGTSGGVMTDTFPKIASMLVRESGGRMVQVSAKSFCKYSRTAFNFTSGACVPCQTGVGNTWRVGCSDTYSSGFSGLSSLGPTTEIDPWLGTWPPVGSYFDRGDPAVTGPAATDGVQSPITSSDPIKNRMIVQESELLVPGATFWGEVHVVVIGEPGDNRMNNMTARRFTVSNNGTTWTASTTGTAVIGPVLTQWTGAQTAAARNGNDDGHFMVGWKVTGPQGGFWHYEYAVHNIDNNAGGGAFRVPVCPTARVRNLGFRDIDTDPLDQWTMSASGSEIAWLAAANNPLDWNTLYNFWFDCDAAPTSGSVAIDRARPGAGAIAVNVAVQVPGLLGHEYVGDGCGSPAPSLFGESLPSVPNLAYGLALQGTPATLAALAIGVAPDNAALGGGCTAWVNLGQPVATTLTVSNLVGRTAWAIPISASLLPMDLWCQGMELVNNGPLLGTIALSNGLRIRLGMSGCP